jgi:hypothetical protein
MISGSVVFRNALLRGEGSNLPNKNPVVFKLRREGNFNR